AREGRCSSREEYTVALTPRRCRRPCTHVARRRLYGVSRRMRFSPSQGFKVMTRRMSLAVKLPLLMSVVLASVLGIALAVTYTTLQRVAVTRAAEQLARATRQLTSLAAATVPTQHARFLPVANDSAI